MTSINYRSTRSSFILIHYSEDRKIYRYPAQILNFFSIVVSYIDKRNGTQHETLHKFANVRWFEDKPNNIYYGQKFKRKSIDDVIPLQRINCRFTPYFYKEGKTVLMKPMPWPPRLWN